MIVGTLLVCLAISVHGQNNNAEDLDHDNKYESDKESGGHSGAGDVTKSLVMMDGASISVQEGGLNYNPDQAKLTTDLFEIHDTMINDIVKRYTDLAALLGDPKALHEDTFWAEKGREEVTDRYKTAHDAGDYEAANKILKGSHEKHLEELAKLEEKYRKEICGSYKQPFKCGSKEDTCSWHETALVGTDKCRVKTCADHAAAACNGKQWDTITTKWGAKCVVDPADDSCTICADITGTTTAEHEENCGKAGTAATGGTGVVNETCTWDGTATCSEATAKQAAKAIAKAAAAAQAAVCTDITDLNACVSDVGCTINKNGVCAVATRRRLGDMPHLQALIVN